ncbi:hypothetical protein A2954_03535 [Candidatus Roizmanbacteria bacterium RIFCSPLOWO2_01_FULL_37_12]|uniref:Polymerase nucleotidyl transferase domain-containing protein n=1 Tax=Candidatus Roizmanbacteria bacterium RIFCSPLOWO2_01_FULL_37_12 TaxID=1802056 RepID=A0A1F7IFA8_9BACT|nr:MAG: hypothetical protein A2954_03535 [Candidatus Roizmanbacteria bacterium RIFCSPLOWO2_01_FULL_37_12]
MKRIKNWKLELRNLEKEILATLKYFFFFGYPPTLEEIHTFLKKKASKRRIMSILEKMVKKSLVARIFNTQFSIFNEFSNKNALNITNFNFNINFKFQISNSDRAYRYTLGEYIKNNNQQSTINNYLKRQQISINKLSSWKFNLYVKLLSLVPPVKLVGLSGSVAMLNADEDHDIDLFIITAKNRLWTGRFIILILAQLLGLRRRREDNTGKDEHVAGGNPLTDSGVQYKNKVCLNLFFDEKNLKIPKFKQTEYVAHEVLQMKPLIQKDDIYLRFIDPNKWVFDIFPNSKIKFQSSNIESNRKRKVQINSVILILNLICNLDFVIWIFNMVESILKNLQLKLITQHQTSEIVTDFQLWFHPDDFEKKLKKSSKFL